MAMVLQRPWVAGAVVLVLWLLADRAWLSRTGASRWLQRRRLESKLRTRLEVNPHDRDARFQLAELLVKRGQHDEATELIARNLAAGDQDDETLFVAGVAALGTSAADGAERGEAHLSRARDKSPSFRSGAIDVALGRGRLARGQHAEAEAALRDAITAQPGSVEAHVLLARALAGQDKSAEATQTKARAWKLYTEAPRFKRRQIRAWAWRANPWAAVRYVAVVVGVVGTVVVVLPRILPTMPDYGDPEFEMIEDGFNVSLADPPRASRFEIAMGDTPDPSGRLLMRFDLNENGRVDLERKVYIGDLWCRLRTHYPDLPATPPAQLEVVDKTSGQTFGVQPLVRAFEMGDAQRATILAFEALLESTDPTGCSAVVETNGVTIDVGIRDGVPYDEIR